MRKLINHLNRKIRSELGVDFMGHQSNPDPMAKTNQPQFDPQWAKAKNVCRLNLDDIRMAKELGISPQSLIKNRPKPIMETAGQKMDLSTP